MHDGVCWSSSWLGIQGGLCCYDLFTKEIVVQRNMKTVEDLNIGDLATFMEVYLPMECHADFSWNQYLNLNNFYGVCKKVNHYETVHKPFLEFCENYRHHRDAGTTASWGSFVWQVIVGIRTPFRMGWIKIWEL